MTRIEDRLAALARAVREDVERDVDVNPAATPATTPEGARNGKRTPLLLAAAAALAVTAVVGFTLTGDDDGQLVAGDDEDEQQAEVDEQRTDGATTPTTTATTAAPTDAGLDFDLLGAFPAAELMPGSMIYAGVPGALFDHWTVSGATDEVPTVDFEEQAVFMLSPVQWESCPRRLSSLQPDPIEIHAVFDETGEDECGPATEARTYVVGVDRDDLPPTFTLVLPVAVDGSYPEQRLDVDLSSNFASSNPPRDPDPITPQGPDVQAPGPGREITFDRMGDIHLGQVLDRADVSWHDGSTSCGYWGPDEPSHDGDEPPYGLAGGPDPDAATVLSIMVGPRHSRYRTTSGVGIGTTLDTLERIYGDDLVVDRADGWDNPTDGLLASYTDVAAVRHGDNALTFYLTQDVVERVKLSSADFWGDDEGCA